MLFRFILLILLIKNSISATTDELKNELSLVRQDIGLLKAENKNQSDQITFLKGMVESQNKIIDAKIVEELNKKIKDCAITGDESLSPEQKQPFRIIPSVYSGAQRNKSCRVLTTVVYDGVFKSSKITLSGSSTTSPDRFYGQPTSCSDLSQLGYTLNGFYVVKSNNESTNSGEIKLDNVFCAFKQPEGAFNPSLIEKRIISRRDTSKSDSSIIKMFNATRSTDCNLTNEFKSYSKIQIHFNIANLNLAEAFNTKTGIFTVQKSGWHLFVFRSMIYFPDLKWNYMDENPILVQIYVLKNGRWFDRGFEGELGSDYVNQPRKELYVDFNTFVRLNRGDNITIATVPLQKIVKFMSSNMSFTGYYLSDV